MRSKLTRLLVALVLLVAALPMPAVAVLSADNGRGWKLTATTDETINFATDQNSFSVKPLTADVDVYVDPGRGPWPVPAGGSLTLIQVGDFQTLRIDGTVAQDIYVSVWRKR